MVEKNELYHKKNNNLVKILKDLKTKIISCFKNTDYKDKNYQHFKKIKTLVNQFKIKFIDPNPKQSIDNFIKSNKFNLEINDSLYKNLITSTENLLINKTWIEYIDVLSSCIIEFYAILLFFCYDKQINFLHSGLIHSANIVWLLRNFYNFESVMDVGQTDDTFLNDNNKIINCIGL